MYTVPESANTWTPGRRSIFNNSVVDVGKIVRSWKIGFSGLAETTSIEEFLQRVQECNRSSNLSDAELINGMTELLSGLALQWYRQTRHRWHTWQDFCDSARLIYGVDKNFQQRLSREAEQRTQHPEEPVRDYIICLLTILSKMQPAWPLSQQIDLLFANLLPVLQKQIKRERIADVDTFIREAREAEYLINAEKYYQPPPPPLMSLLPETAFQTGETETQAESDSAQQPTM